MVNRGATGFNPRRESTNKGANGCTPEIRSTNKGTTSFTPVQESLTRCQRIQPIGTDQPDQKVLNVPDRVHTSPQQALS